MNLRLATRVDDDTLRQAVGDTPMPGWIRLAYAREPSFLAAQSVGHSFSQVIVGEEEDRLLGFGCRGIRPVYVNGTPCELGYLSGLRAFREARSRMGLARGYRFLHELHGDSRVPAYLSTIVDANDEAKAILTSQRAGLPAYLDQGRFWTYAIALSQRRAPRAEPVTGVSIRTGDDIGAHAIAAFLNRVGPARQFFPVVNAGDFGTPYLRGLAAADFMVALSGDRMIGAVAKWDQSAFKQVHVCGYSRRAGLLRNSVNLALKATGYAPLPSPGSDLRIFYAAFPCIEGDDPAILHVLLERLYEQNRYAGYHSFAIGFHEHDPLSHGLRGFLKFEYESRLYVVAWEDGKPFTDTLDKGRVPHLEPATL